MEQTIFSDVIALIGTILVIFSLIMKDIGPMRFFLLFASLAFLIYAFSIDSPALIIACTLFITANGYFLIKHTSNLRMGKVPEKLRDLYSIYKRHISNEDFMKLLVHSSNKALVKENLLKEGEKVEHLYLIVTGKVEIGRGDELVTTLGPGNFIGEMGLLTDGTARATVKCKGIVELLVWDKNYFLQDSNLRLLVCINLVDKLLNTPNINAT